MSSLIFRVASRLIVPLALIFAVFLYFKGHQEPGGGFVGGLIAAVGLIVHRMAFGAESLRQLLPARERTLIAWGLALALGTGAAALLLGPLVGAANGGPLPFLTSNFGFVPLPGGEDYRFEWASVMVFDLGVMLVVAGVVVGMIEALSQEL